MKDIEHDNTNAIEHDKLMRKIFHIGIKSTKNMMRALAADYKDRLPGCKVINKYDHLIVKYCGFEFKVDPRINMCLTGHPICCFNVTLSREYGC